MTSLSLKTQTAAAESHLHFTGTFAALFPSSTSRRSSQNDSAEFPPGILFVCRTRTWNKIGNRQIKCDTIKANIVCLLAPGLHGMKEPVHGNSLMEPDYVFALKLTECKTGGGSVSVQRGGGYLVRFILFSLFKQILLCLYGERQMAWGGGGGHERAWLWSSRGLLVELWLSWKALPNNRDKWFTSHFQPYHGLHSIILIVPPPSPSRSFLLVWSIHTFPVERRGSFPVLCSLSGL